MWINWLWLYLVWTVRTFSLPLFEQIIEHLFILLEARFRLPSLNGLNIQWISFFLFDVKVFLLRYFYALLHNFRLHSYLKHFLKLIFYFTRFDNWNLNTLQSLGLIMIFYNICLSFDSDHSLFLNFIVLIQSSVRLCNLLLFSYIFIRNGLKTFNLWLFDNLLINFLCILNFFGELLCLHWFKHSNSIFNRAHFGYLNYKYFISIILN